MVAATAINLVATTAMRHLVKMLLLPSYLLQVTKEQQVEGTLSQEDS